MRPDPPPSCELGQKPTGRRKRPDRAGLFLLASSQRGYFTAAQGRAHGYSGALLAHHARQGTFLRAVRGVYRFRDYPSTPLEEVVGAWLAAGADTAVVSHQGALEWWGLTDSIPSEIHFTVPRTRRHLPRLPGVRFHTSTRSFTSPQVRAYDGVCVTAPARTIVDLAEAGAADELLADAVAQSMARGWVTVTELLDQAQQRSPRAYRTLTEILSGGDPGVPPPVEPT